MAYCCTSLAVGTSKGAIIREFGSKFSPAEKRKKYETEGSESSKRFSEICRKHADELYFERRQLPNFVPTSLINSIKISSPNRFNKYLETAHYPSDCWRYQNVYPHQYARQIESIKAAYADLNRRLKIQRKRGKVTAVARWSTEHADKMFPNICERTYCVPPVFVNGYGLKKHTDCSLEFGAPIFNTGSTESDIRGSNSHRTVMCAFQCLSHHLERRRSRCMFLVSDYSYDNYLRWVRDPRHLCHEHSDWFRRLEPDEALVAVFTGNSHDSELCFRFPEDAGVRRHVTDLIVFHETKGVLMVQIKSIGAMETGRERAKFKIEECLSKQLLVDSHVLRVLVHPERAPDVTRVLALPNISAEELSALGLDNSLTSDVTFLLKNNLPDVLTGVPESQTDISSFQKWFKGLPEKRVPLDMIKELVGRYVGALSMPIDLLEVNERSRVRDFCDVTLFVGRLFKRLVLTGQQISILQTPKFSKRVYLSGPPGSGKTLLLITRARMFVMESVRHHVIVLNLYRGAKGRAVGALIAQALRHHDVTSGRCQGLNGEKTHHVRLDLNDIGSVHNDDTLVKAVRKELPKGVAMKNVMFVIDEIFAEKRWQTVWAAFSTSFKDSTLWCAGTGTAQPEGLRDSQTISLDLVLRCPPAVQNVLHRTDWDDKRRMLYTGDANRSELASNGPAPLCVRHERHQVGVSVRDCSQCAVELARLLQDTFRLVQRPERHETLPSNGSRSDQSPALLPCDVVVLYNIPRQEFQRANRDSATGEVELTTYRFQLHAQEMSTCKFFDTLKDELKNASLRLIDRLDDRGLEGSVSSKEILVSWVDIVQGLEKDVVIFLPGDISPKDYGSSTEERSAIAKPYQAIATAESGLEKNLESWVHLTRPKAKANNRDAQNRKCEMLNQELSELRRVDVTSSVTEKMSEADKHPSLNRVFLKECQGSAARDREEQQLAAMDLDALKKEKTVKKWSRIELNTQQAPSQDKAKKIITTSVTQTVRECTFFEKAIFRELPVPGLSEDQSATERHTEMCQASSKTEREVTLFNTKKISNGGEATSSRHHLEIQTSTIAPGVADMLWRSEDIDRYSDWDQTNLFLAASRCCAQLIMVVP